MSSKVIILAKLTSS